MRRYGADHPFRRRMNAQASPRGLAYAASRGADALTRPLDPEQIQGDGDITRVLKTQRIREVHRRRGWR